MQKYLLLKTPNNQLLTNFGEAMNHFLTFAIQYLFANGIERYEKFDVHFTCTNNETTIEELHLHFANKLNSFLVEMSNREWRLENFNCSILQEGFLDNLNVRNDGSQEFNNPDFGITVIKFSNPEILPGLLNLTNILYINIVPE